MCIAKWSKSLILERWERGPASEEVGGYSSMDAYIFVAHSHLFRERVEHVVGEVDLTQCRERANHWGYVAHHVVREV